MENKKKHIELNEEPGHLQHGQENWNGDLNDPSTIKDNVDDAQSNIRSESDTNSLDQRIENERQEK